MELTALLEKKKETIVNEWFEQVIQTYAPDTAMFYQGQKDAFANPVGSTTRHALTRLFNLLLKHDENESPAAIIDPLIRIRAVQNFTPTQAAGFVFFLKPIVRNLYKKNQKKIHFDELLALESRIDMLALTGFDVFMACREKIYSMKTNVERDKIYKAFARAGLIKEVPADEPDPKFI
ncbi:MAG: RsbRD N-terminal domain-containing protein [Deltaproteobacteria bacterium]|nr:RsbRD N-terminal domain-containing protein [Deltaproteobacteria bacterium]MBW2175674.1 RsbRD N-terminal domain-containing protein [Deltaproteobacteria bacterium]MBW2296742.1 RsbRD N-terminal domain-containing protein [Deltaproteobacteria bacterium]